MDILNIRSRMKSGRMTTIGVIHYCDEEKKEHYIDILENKLINRRTIPSGTKLTIFYDPENSDNAYIEVEEQVLRLAKKLHREKIIRMFTRAAIGFICINVAFHIFNIWKKSQGPFKADEMEQLSNLVVTVTAALIVIFFVSLEQLQYEMLLLDFESRCTFRANGIILKWSEHKISSDGWSSDPFYLAEVSFQDESGNTYIADIAGKK